MNPVETGNDLGSPAAPETEAGPTARNPAQDQAPPRPPWRVWGGVLAVAVGIFSIVTAEQLPVGLLPDVSRALGVSEGLAGLMVTAPGIVAALAAPIVPLVVGRLDRRRLLGALMALMVGAHALSVIAPNFAILMLARVLVGVSIGGFWAIAGGLAVRLVPAARVPRATSLIFGGVAAANVLGVPLGTTLGSIADWRVAFGALGGLGLLVLLGLLVALPRLPAAEPVRIRALTAQLRNPAVRLNVVATFLIVTGHFAAYTFVSPVLQTISGFSEGSVGSMLLLYGAAGLIGNFVAGSAAGRSVRITMAVISVALAAVLLLYPLLGGTTISGAIMLVLWGLAFGGVSVGLQTWILKAAPDTTESATALWVSIFNLSIALGALVGGAVVDSVGLTIALLGGGVLALLTIGTVLATRRSGPA